MTDDEGTTPWKDALKALSLAAEKAAEGLRDFLSAYNSRDKGETE